MHYKVLSPIKVQAGLRNGWFDQENSNQIQSRPKTSPISFIPTRESSCIDYHRTYNIMQESANIHYSQIKFKNQANCLHINKCFGFVFWLIPEWRFVQQFFRERWFLDKLTKTRLSLFDHLCTNSHHFTLQWKTNCNIIIFSPTTSSH